MLVVFALNQTKIKLLKIVTYLVYTVLKQKTQKRGKTITFTPRLAFKRNIQ